MLIKLDTTPDRKPVVLATASKMDDVLPPKARARNFFPESRRDEVADDARLGSVTAPVKSDTFTFEGASETSLNNWLIKVGSPALLASPPKRQAVDDSRPWDTACLGSPKSDAISPIVRGSKVLNSELKTG
jgi:hypothetical protein